MEELYTIQEVAQICKVDRTTVYYWMRTGKLKFVLVGSRRRVRRSDLDQFIQAGDLTDTEGTSEKNGWPGLAWSIEFN